jgi:hydroxymethylpyrimidine/phosphomethylpyrimidine kinase
VVARVLIVAGSDSGGGAGIQADIKTVTALGGFAMTAVTAVTVQNTQAVAAIHDIPPDIVAGQIVAVLSDLGADVVKTGMLGNEATIVAVHRALEQAGAALPRVVDPVMVASSGAALLYPEAVAALRTLLIAGAALVTPNLPEAEALIGQPVRCRADMEQAVPALRDLGAAAVLLKGGHLVGDTIHDLLIGPEGLHWFSDARIPGRATHGTGCTLASAIAVGLAQGRPLKAAVARARAYVRTAIAAAPGLGRGHGPLNHAHTVRPFEPPAD